MEVLRLVPEERQQLLEFLRSLSAEQWDTSGLPGLECRCHCARHVLGDDLGRLCRVRDRVRLAGTAGAERNDVLRETDLVFRRLSNNRVESQTLSTAGRSTLHRLRHGASIHSKRPLAFNTNTDDPLRSDTEHIRVESGANRLPPLVKISASPRTSIIRGRHGSIDARSSMTIATRGLLLTSARR